MLQVNEFNNTLHMDLPDISYFNLYGSQSYIQVLIMNYYN